MASISLGMAEGQKIAQGLALGQMNTIAGMSKASADAEKEAQYYRPGAVAMRDLIDYESLQATDNIVKNRDLIRALNLDPINAGPAVLEQTMGKSDPASKWVIEPADAIGSTYKAVEYSADGTKGRGDGIYREIALGDKSQTAGVLAQNLTATTLDQLKRIEALKSASDASHVKMGEKKFEAQLENLYKTAPTLASLEKRTKMMNNTELAATGMKVQGDANVAYIGKGASDKEVVDFAKTQAAFDGIKIDDKGHIESINGTAIEQAPMADRVAAQNKFNEYLQAADYARKVGVGVPGANPASMKRAGMGMPTKAQAASARQQAQTGVPAQGLPTRQQDSAAQAAARRINATRLSEEARAKAEYEQLVLESTPGYKPRFY